MKLWFEQYPERLEYELQALRGAGYAPVLDDTKMSAGQVEISVLYPYDGKLHSLTARFPEFYPYLPLEIYGLTLPIGKHICPTSGLLCLMQDLQSSWKTTDTLALMLAEKVPAILNAHSDQENPEEAHEGTQRSGQYPYDRNSVLLTEDWEIPKQTPYGKLLIGLESGPEPLRGAVLEIQDAQGLIIVKMAPEIAKRYQKRIRGRWLRLDSPPSGTGGGPLADAINVVASVKSLKLDSGVDVVGLLFPEESGYQTFVENWVFTVRTGSWIKSGQYGLARSESVSVGTMKARVPTLIPLEHKKVLIIGVGAIGSMIAWQLARSGVGTLNLLDQDFVQTGNLPRWMLGLPAVGQGKAQVMASYLKSSYPLIEVNFHEYRLGSPSVNHMQSLMPLLQDADLVIDATAERCISHLLSDLCNEASVPYLWATGTQGSQGGVVGRVVPKKTEGCWTCYQHQIQGGTIISPAKEDIPNIQPKGCFHPTFTGTGFDMDNISLVASRLAVSTLCRGEENAYPDVDWDVAVLDLWSKDGKPIAPHWTEYPLSRHPGCKGHG